MGITKKEDRQFLENLFNNFSTSSSQTTSSSSFSSSSSSNSSSASGFEVINDPQYENPILYDSINSKKYFYDTNTYTVGTEEGVNKVKGFIASGTSRGNLFGGSVIYHPVNGKLVFLGNGGWTYLTDTYSETPLFASGIENGPVSYTGLAMLHGTPSAPEYVLNSDQAYTLLRNMATLKQPQYTRVGENNDCGNKYVVQGDVVLENCNDPAKF